MIRISLLLVLLRRGIVEDSDEWREWSFAFIALVCYSSEKFHSALLPISPLFHLVTITALLC